MYGKELIVDLYKCSSALGRVRLETYLSQLCKLIDMNREVLHWWDYEGEGEDYIETVPDHLLGVSVIQFITTSNITIHTIERLKEIYINIFSCKDFDTKRALDFTVNFFLAEDWNWNVIERGKKSGYEMEVNK